MNVKKIVLINCYFGTLPSYFNLFLDSCRKNPSINFLFFTDCTVKDAPSNFKVIKISFETLKKYIQKKFDFKIKLNFPYKLCDYKPAYGYIFDEYIRNFDYWGYCDIDLIFGDLRKFLTEEKLQSYEKIYQLGHLTVYKNSTENNKRFMLPGEPYYKDSFTTDMITVFDESEGIQKKFSDYGIGTYIKRDYADISQKYYKFRLSDSFIDIPKKQNNYKHQAFIYENGKVFRIYVQNSKIKKDEFAYIHMQKRDMPQNGVIGDNYFITNKGFINIDSSDINEEKIKRLNKFNFNKQMQMTYRHNLWRIKRKVQKIREQFK